MDLINVSIAVIDYSIGKIKMYTAKMLPDYQSEDIEAWLYDNTDYNCNTCYFMCSSNGIEVEYVQ